MKEICPIIQLKSDELLINTLNLDDSLCENFGNGFFISSGGLIASVAHVLKNGEGINSYALLNETLHKIIILSRRLTDENEDHLDIAIGQIDLGGMDFFDPMQFERVQESSSVTTKGFSRRLVNVETCEKLIPFDLHGNYVEIPGICLDTIYSSRSIIMKNSFTVVMGDSPQIINASSINFKGLSGSLIVNENNLIVGILKAGGEIGIKIVGHAMHIEKIKEMYLRL